MSQLITRYRPATWMTTGPSGWLRRGQPRMKRGHPIGQKFSAFYPMAEGSDRFVRSIVNRHSEYVTGDVTGVLTDDVGTSRATWKVDGGVFLPFSSTIRIPSALGLPDGGFCIFLEFMYGTASGAFVLMGRDSAGLNDGDLQLHTDVGTDGLTFRPQTAADVADARAFTAATPVEFADMWRVVCRVLPDKRTSELYAVRVLVDGSTDEGYNQVPDTLTGDFTGTAAIDWVLGGGIAGSPVGTDGSIIAFSFGVTDQDMEPAEIKHFLNDPFDMVEFSHDEIGFFNPAYFVPTVAGTFVEQQGLYLGGGLRI